MTTFFADTYLLRAKSVYSSLLTTSSVTLVFCVQIAPENCVFFSDSILYFREHANYLFCHTINARGQIRRITLSFSLSDSFLMLHISVFAWKFEHASVFWNSHTQVIQSKLRWPIKKNTNFFPNHSYFNLMYIPYTTFRHSFQRCWGTCHSGAPIFVSLHRRMMPPAMQTTYEWLIWPCRRGTADHQTNVSDAGTYENLLALYMGYRGIIKLFSAKCRDESCGGSVWASIVMKHHNIVSERSKLLPAVSFCALP
jgi:hypothetical protein